MSLNNTKLKLKLLCSSVNPDSRKGLQCLVCTGQSVWLAAQGSSRVSLYHAATYEQLTEVDVAPAVATKLQGKEVLLTFSTAKYTVKMVMKF